MDIEWSYSNAIIYYAIYDTYFQIVMWLKPSLDVAIMAFLFKSYITYFTLFIWSYI